MRYLICLHWLVTINEAVSAIADSCISLHEEWHESRFLCFKIDRKSITMHSRDFFQMVQNLSLFMHPLIQYKASLNQMNDLKYLKSA